MSKDPERYRGTSQFVKKRIPDPQDPEGIRKIDSEFARRRPDRHSKIVYDATTLPQDSRGGGISREEMSVEAFFGDKSPKRHQRLIGRAISAARNRLSGPGNPKRS